MLCLLYYHRQQSDSTEEIIRNFGQERTNMMWVVRSFQKDISVSFQGPQASILPSLRGLKSDFCVSVIPSPRQLVAAAPANLKISAYKTHGTPRHVWNE